jgi:hypothetical protein
MDEFFGAGRFPSRKRAPPAPLLAIESLRAMRNTDSAAGAAALAA